MANNRYKKKKRPPESNYVPPFDRQILDEPVSNLNFRAENTLSLLEGGGLKTIGDVLKREEKDFYKIFTFKKRNLLDVKGAIRARNLSLKPTEVVEEKKTEGEELAVIKPPRAQSRDGQNRDGQNRDGQRRQGPSSQQNQQGQRQSRPGDRNDRNNAQGKDRRGGRKQDAVKEAPKKQAPPEPQDIYIKVNKGGKWGFSDRSSGEIVIEPVYDEVFSFKEDLCCVEKDELFGFINREGAEIIPIIYECALSFSEGLACIYKGGKCGYINAQNEVVIDFKFDAGTSFEEGSCRIKRDGKWGELRLETPSEVRWIN
ncbi:MAG: WG repeat-containing protein [Clostridia bacterium]|nr:WG repeat-containing protein [Clostridia bacterium]